MHWEDLEGLVEREVGGGIRMGNTCKSMADSFQCMTKPTTIKKIIKKEKKNKLNKFKKFSIVLRYQAIRYFYRLFVLVHATSKRKDLAEEML